MAVDLMNGLIRAYDMQEGTGTTVSDRTGTDNLTVNSGTWSTSNLPSNYFSCVTTHDGSTNMFNTSSTYSPKISHSGGISISMWIRRTGSSNYYAFIAYDGGSANQIWVVDYSTLNGSSIRLGPDPHVTEADNRAEGLSSWVHVVGTCGTGASAVTKLYVNGTLTDTTTAASNTNQWDSFIIGRAGSSGKWIGQIATCYIWDRELNSDEAAALYNNGDGLLYDDFIISTVYTTTINSSSSITNDSNLISTGYYPSYKIYIRGGVSQ